LTQAHVNLSLLAREVASQKYLKQHSRRIAGQSFCDLPKLTANAADPMIESKTAPLLFLLGSRAAAATVFSIGYIAIVTPVAAQGKIPQLQSSDFAWLGGSEWGDPPRGLRGPLRNDPDYPNKDPLFRLRMGNWKDPVLKPWAAAQMKASNDELVGDRRKVPFAAQARCYPGGVPGQLLFAAEPLYFIQTSKIVYMIWQYDHMVRRVFLTDKHSENVKPSWFGESIGTYESEDTLVVDTIGLQSKSSYIDNHRTPHSDKLHVTERFTVGYDGSLAALVRVEDPDTFNEPLFMVQRWRRVPNELLETVCAENNVSRFEETPFPMPKARRPDF
jgi:hypothetical protein